MNPVIALRQIEARAVRIRAQKGPGWEASLLRCRNEWEEARLLMASRCVATALYTWADVMTPAPEPKGVYHPGPAEDEVEYARR
jgi:hypothetical protein